MLGVDVDAAVFEEAREAVPARERVADRSASWMSIGSEA